MIHLTRMHHVNNKQLKHFSTIKLEGRKIANTMMQQLNLFTLLIINIKQASPYNLIFYQAFRDIVKIYKNHNQPTEFRSFYIKALKKGTIYFVI